jgi:hypothetical protein
MTGQARAARGLILSRYASLNDGSLGHAAFISPS